MPVTQPQAGKAGFDASPYSNCSIVAGTPDGLTGSVLHVRTVVSAASAVDGRQTVAMVGGGGGDKCDATM